MQQVGPFSQPGKLSLCELPGRCGGAGDSLFQAAASFEMRPELPVADSAQRGQARVQVPPAPEIAHFLKQPGAQHALQTALDTPMQGSAILGPERQLYHPIFRERIEVSARVAVPG